MGKGMDLINLYLDGYTAICVSTIEQMWEGACCGERACPALGCVAALLDLQWTRRGTSPLTTASPLPQGGLQRFDDQLLSMSTWRVSFRQNIPTTKLTPVTTTGYHRP